MQRYNAVFCEDFTSFESACTNINCSHFQENQISLNKLKRFFPRLEALRNRTKHNSSSGQCIFEFTSAQLFQQLRSAYRISNFWNEKILSTWVMLCVCVCVYVYAVCVANILVTCIYLFLLLLLVRLTLMRSILRKMKSFHTQCGALFEYALNSCLKIGTKTLQNIFKILWNFR